MRNCTGHLAVAALVAVTFLSACTAPVNYDVILRGGTIYDGSGQPSFPGDIAFDRDTIAAYGELGDATRDNGNRRQQSRRCTRLYQHDVLGQRIAA